MVNDSSINDLEMVKKRAAELRVLGTGRLTNMLEQEFLIEDDKTIDTSLIEQILDILDEREPMQMKVINVEKSLEEFKKNVVPFVDGYNSTARSSSVYKLKSLPKWHHNKGFRFILITAVLLLLIATTVLATDIGSNIWGQLTRWGKDNFQIGVGTVADSGGDDLELMQDEGVAIPNQKEVFTSIDDALAACKVPVTFPGWIPSDLEFVLAEISETPMSQALTIIFQSSTRNLMFNAITYESIEESFLSFEKDDEYEQLLNIGETEYYIMQNIDQIQAIWVVDKTVFSINGEISAEEITKILEVIDLEEQK